MPKTKSKICKELIKDYCANCTFAGIHFIADDTKHWIERILWAVLVILSWYGSALLVISAWEAFTYSPISFGLETTYTEWDTQMPTVAICEVDNKKKRFEVADKLWPDPNHLVDLEDTLTEIAYYRGSSFVLVNTCFLEDIPDPDCLMSNYSYYAKLVRNDCDDILKNCSYNDKPFPCCEYFQLIDTDMGPCYIINSIQVKHPHPYPMQSNMRNPRGVLKFDVAMFSTLYTIGEDEVPTITTLLSSTLNIKLGYIYRRRLSVKHIENDPLVASTTPIQRVCRFHYENDEGLYPHYSYSACTVLCRKKAQLEMCQCNDHFMPGASDAERCNISGMACLNLNVRELTILKPSWNSQSGLVCDCMPSCDESEITVIKDIVNRKKVKTSSHVEIVLAYLSTERLKRNVVRSRLDLVVSVGGTTGLFVGASLLSFVELFFFFTVRFVNNILMDRRETKNVAAKREEIPIEENVLQKEMRRRDLLLKEFNEIPRAIPSYYHKLYYPQRTS